MAPIAKRSADPAGRLVEAKILSGNYGFTEFVNRLNIVTLLIVMG
jgi:hypothetical protein